MVEQLCAGQRFSAQEPATNIHPATGEGAEFICAERTNPVREIFDDKICHEAILISIVNQGTSATVKTTSFPADDFGSSKVVRYSTGVYPSPLPILAAIHPRQAMPLACARRISRFS